MAHDNDGNLLVANTNVQYARDGKQWSVQTATLFAAIVAVPTTLANLEVNNNGSRYMVVDEIWAVQITATAVSWAIVPWAQVGAQVFSGNTGLVFGGGNGASYTSGASSEARSAITQTVVANGWRVFPGNGGAFGTAAATPGPVVIGEVNGKLVVPPGLSLHVAVMGAVNTASAVHAGASFHWLAA